MLIVLQCAKYVDHHAPIIRRIQMSQQRLNDVVRRCMRQQHIIDERRYKTLKREEWDDEAWRWHAAVNVFGVVFMAVGFYLALWLM